MAPALVSSIQLSVAVAPPHHPHSVCTFPSHEQIPFIETGCCKGDSAAKRNSWRTQLYTGLPWPNRNTMSLFPVLPQRFAVIGSVVSYSLCSGFLLLANKARLSALATRQLQWRPARPLQVVLTLIPSSPVVIAAQCLFCIVAIGLTHLLTGAPKLSEMTGPVWKAYLQCEPGQSVLDPPKRPTAPRVPSQTASSSSAAFTQT